MKKIGPKSENKVKKFKLGKTGGEGLKMMESDKNGEKNAKQVPKFSPRTGNKPKNAQIRKKKRVAKDRKRRKVIKNGEKCKKTTTIMFQN